MTSVTLPTIDPRPAIDRLAIAAALLALIAMPLLGVGHPLTHALTITTLGVFGWLLIRPARSLGRAIRALCLHAPVLGVSAGIVAFAGVASGALRWWLDTALLGGQGGLEFYDWLLMEYGVIGVDASVHWALLAIYVPVLLLVVVFDGVFFVGLIQERVAARANLHAGVHIQALLFSLPHTFASPSADVAYGIGAYLAGLAYGYIFASFRNHWIAASLVWLHVTTVWVIMLWTRA